MRPCRPVRPSASSLLQVDDVEEATADTVADAGPGDSDGEMGLSGTGAADEDDVALVGEEVAAGEVADQGLVDRGVIENEVVDVLGQGQLGDRHLVLDRARLLLGDLGGEQVADDVLGSCWRLTAAVMISSKAFFMP